jgi:hypothetical protein
MLNNACLNCKFWSSIVVKSLLKGKLWGDCCEAEILYENILRAVVDKTHTGQKMRFSDS